MRVVKTRALRQKEILESAKAVFLDKGFEKTTMEDIIARTSLSKGGVYYYYSTTAEILHALMLEGMRYRMAVIHKSARYGSEWDDEALIDMLVDKVLDSNEYMRIYVMCLQAAQRDKRLREIFQALKEETKNILVEHFGVKNQEMAAPFYSDLLLQLMNSIMLGAEILAARDTFEKNRPLLVSMMKSALVYFREGTMIT